MSVYKRHFQECPDNTQVNLGDLWRGPDGLRVNTGNPDQWIGPNPVLRINPTVVGAASPNLNTAAVTPFTELFGAVNIDTQPGNYSVALAAAQIRINQAGVYRLFYEFDYQGGLATNSARFNMRVFWTLGATQISPNGQHNYIRDASGHNESSQTGQIIHRFSAGDVVTLNKQRVAGPATSDPRLQTTASHVSIERVA